MNQTPALRNFKFGALADAIPQLVWSARADGTVDYMNRAWLEYTGQTLSEAIDAWEVPLHPDDRARTLAAWTNCVAHLDRYEIEYRIRGVDGTYRWFVARGRRVADDDGGVRWYGTTTDIDALKLAQDAIRESAETFRKLANSLPQIIFITDGNGKNTFLNHRWYGYTGIRRQDEHAIERAMHPDDLAEMTRKWRSALDTGAVFEMEYRLRRVDDVYHWFLGRAIPFRSLDDTIVEWFGSCTDIEDQKRAEADLRTAYEREHRIAATLQKAFLTHTMPQVPGLRFDAVYRPADTDAEVGGDWYDAIELDDGRIVLSIGDVAGHGLDAAVVMGNLRQAIRVVAQIAAFDPVAMLDAVDRSFRRESPDTIVTSFIGIIDPTAKTLTYASAGHPPPLLFTASRVEELPATGLPLGLRRAGIGKGATIGLPASGTLVLYTDGLIESTRDVFEGERRLRAALTDVARVGSEHPAADIVGQVLLEGARDDVAVLTVTFGERAAVRETLPQQVA